MSSASTYLDLDLFMRDAVPCPMLDILVPELRQELQATGLIDMEELRRRQDWSWLNQQVVGAEVF